MNNPLHYAASSRGTGSTGMVHNDEAADPSQKLKSIVDLLAPVSALAGGILYFGWVRTTALFDYFGVDETLLGLSVQDYLLRSTDILFRPALYLLTACSLGLLFLTLTNGMVETLHRETLQRWVFAPATGTGFVLLSIAFLGLNESVLPLLGAICLGLGSFILFCSLRIAVSIYAMDKDHWARTLNKWAPALTGITIFAALSWATTVYAQQAGSSLASFIAQNPRALPQTVPQVILYSRFPLDSNRQSGVTESKLPGPTDAMNYRYTGYRLLIYSNNRWFLITSTPFGSEPNLTSVLIDDGSIRVTICHHECDHL